MLFFFLPNFIDFQKCFLKLFKTGTLGGIVRIIVQKTHEKFSVLPVCILKFHDFKNNTDQMEKLHRRGEISTVIGSGYFPQVKGSHGAVGRILFGVFCKLLFAQLFQGVQAHHSPADSQIAVAYNVRPLQ